jgi:hypothetical protein
MSATVRTTERPHLPPTARGNTLMPPTAHPSDWRVSGHGASDVVGGGKVVRRRGNDGWAPGVGLSGTRGRLNCPVAGQVQIAALAITVKVFSLTL